MKLSKKTISALSAGAAALGVAAWTLSAHHGGAPSGAPPVAASDPSPEPAVAQAAAAVAEMKTQDKLARVNALLDERAKPDLPALAQQQAVAGNAEVGALLTELSLEKDEYQAIHRQYEEQKERHTVLVVKDPKSAEVKQADAELDRLLDEMRESSVRIQKLTNEAMAAYTADKMKELGIAER